MRYSFRAAATVSCWTEVEAETLAQAKEIAEQRELAGLCHNPHTSEVDEQWHCDTDGSPFNIEHDV